MEQLEDWGEFGVEWADRKQLKTAVLLTTDSGSRGLKKLQSIEGKIRCPFRSEVGPSNEISELATKVFELKSLIFVAMGATLSQAQHAEARKVRCVAIFFFR
jgi:hypothetical protein